MLGIMVLLSGYFLIVEVFFWLKNRTIEKIQFPGKFDIG